MGASSSMPATLPAAGSGVNRSHRPHGASAAFPEKACGALWLCVQDKLPEQAVFDTVVDVLDAPSVTLQRVG